jgi:hypothetical protein
MLWTNLEIGTCSGAPLLHGFCQAAMLDFTKLAIRQQLLLPEQKGWI